MIAELEQGDIGVGPEPFALEQKAGGTIGVAAEAANRDALYFLYALDTFARLDAIVHDVAQPAEHD